MFKYSILLLPLFIIFSCKGQTNPDCLVKLEEKLSPKVNEENEVGEIINIKEEVNCFEWDTLIVQMAMVNKETAERTLGVKIPFDYTNDLFQHESVARLLFVKNDTVIHYILQEAGVDKKTFDNAKNIKSYRFIYLLNNYGNGSFAKIPKDKTIFQTYPIVYHENGIEKSNPKYGLAVKVKQN
ncbi:hypothetical protein [Chryseobacterium lathyri]|uniref:hypothetical protein n=1 Tax=Chryseobacterium lathyri TaxID=395933 RepID=UPI001CBFBE34|nr:hypothetical protein [Chryseobacterium lathyri]